MKIRPLQDRILVKRLESEEKTAGGIIIPDNAKEKPQEGKIIAVGPGSRDESGKVVALDVKAGDRVLFGRYAGDNGKTSIFDFVYQEQTRNWLYGDRPQWQRAFRDGARLDSDVGTTGDTDHTDFKRL